MQREDEIRVRHMLDAAREALSFAAGKTRKDLDRDRVLVLALVKCIEIIGEAATKVGPETRTLYPGVPWPAVVTMRHRLIHAYYDMDVDRVWDTVTEDLPPLIAALEG
ncbi:MAG: DUF86 domain-containing protein [Acidobacteriota bacterium]